MEKKTLRASIISAFIGAVLSFIVGLIINNINGKKLDADKIQTQIADIVKTKEDKVDAVAKYQELKSELKEKASTKEVRDLKENIESNLNNLRGVLEEVNEKSDKLIYMHMRALRSDTLKPISPKITYGVMCKTSSIFDSITYNIISSNELQ